jgi:hypothetical protein
VSTSVTGAVFHRDRKTTCWIPNTVDNGHRVSRSAAAQVDHLGERRRTRQSPISGDQGNVELISQLDIEGIYKSQRFSSPPGPDQEWRQRMPRDRKVFEVEQGLFDLSIGQDSGSVQTPDCGQNFYIDVCRCVTRRVLEATSYRECGGLYGQQIDDD